MINLQEIQKFDKQGMYKIYDKWPSIAEEAYESNFIPVDFGEIKEMIFVGMGGSGALGDVFSSILSKTKIPVSVVKGYHLPNTINSDSLIILTSISGNTAETLSVLNSTKKLDCKIIAFSSGGKMQKFCNNNEIKHIVISTTHSPRASFTKYLYSMLKTFEPILPIEKNEIRQSIIDLENISEKIASHNLSNDNPSLNLAQWISNIPLIYYPWGFQSAAIRFKNSLQENSKSHAIIEDVLEACHNGIVAWEKKTNVQPILLQGLDDHIKTKERWNMLKEFFKEKNIDFYNIFSVNGSILSKIICLIYQLDYCSIYRAVLSGIDPSPIKPIDFIKNKLEN